MPKNSEASEAVRKKLFLHRLEQLLNWDCESDVSAGPSVESIAEKPPPMMTGFMDLAPKPVLPDSVLRFANYVFSNETHDDSRQVLTGLAETLLDVVEPIQRSVTAHEKRIEAVDRELKRSTRALEDRVSKLERELKSILDTLGFSPAATDMRSEPRSIVEEPVEVSALPERSRIGSGRVTNISNSGLGLMLDTDIRIGTHVEVNISGVLVRGEVTRCRREGDHWEAGVRLDQPLTSTWT